jgi:hypothetical protein
MRCDVVCVRAPARVRDGVGQSTTPDKLSTTLVAFLEDVGRMFDDQARSTYDMAKRLREEVGMPPLIRTTKAVKRARPPTDPNLPKYDRELFPAHTPHPTSRIASHV